MNKFKSWLVRILSVANEVRVEVDSTPLGEDMKKSLATGLGAAIDAVIDKELAILPQPVRDAAKTEVASLIAQSGLLK